jgi:hypothetical protein
MSILKRIPDIVIASGVIVGVIGLSTGHRIVGATSMLVACLFTWKRNWCIGAFEELMSSCDDQASHFNAVDSDSSDEADDGHSS